MEKKIKEEARLRSAQKAEQTALIREQKAIEKAERAIKRAANQQMRLQHAQANKVTKSARHNKMKAQKAAELATAEQRREAHVKEFDAKDKQLASFKTWFPNADDPR